MSLAARSILTRGIGFGAAVMIHAGLWEAGTIPQPEPVYQLIGGGRFGRRNPAPQALRRRARRQRDNDIILL